MSWSSDKKFNIEKKDGIIHLTFAEGTTTLEVMSQMLEELLSRFGEGGIPLLIDLRGKSKISSQARAKLKDSKAIELFPAVAYVTHSFMTKLVLNSVIRFVNPPYRCACFSSVEDGLVWLDPYKIEIKT